MIRADNLSIVIETSDIIPLVTCGLRAHPHVIPLGDTPKEAIKKGQ